MLRQSFTTFAPRVLPRVLEAARPAMFLAVRKLATFKAPGSDPLDILKKECISRCLCDEEGYRIPGKHWVFSVAVAPEDRTKVSVINLVPIVLPVQWWHR
jgi:hypothetical protein